MKSMILRALFINKLNRKKSKINKDLYVISINLENIFNLKEICYAITVYMH